MNALLSFNVALVQPDVMFNTCTTVAFLLVYLVFTILQLLYLSFYQRCCVETFELIASSK